MIIRKIDYFSEKFSFRRGLAGKISSCSSISILDSSQFDAPKSLKIIILSHFTQEGQFKLFLSIPHCKPIPAISAVYSFIFFKGELLLQLPLLLPLFSSCICHLGVEIQESKYTIFFLSSSSPPRPQLVSFPQFYSFQFPFFLL